MRQFAIIHTHERGTIIYNVQCEGDLQAHISTMEFSSDDDDCELVRWFNDNIPYMLFEPTRGESVDVCEVTGEITTLNF